MSPIEKQLSIAPLGTLCAADGRPHQHAHVFALTIADFVQPRIDPRVLSRPNGKNADAIQRSLSDQIPRWVASIA